MFPSLIFSFSLHMCLFIDPVMNIPKNYILILYILSDYRIKPSLAAWHMLE